MTQKNFIARERSTVTAWKYKGPNSSVPVWVARKCHDLGNGKLTANTIVGLLPIDQGDYVVLVDEDINSITVVSGKDFETEYEPMPEAGQ